jgi:hypothetical protein
MIARAFGPGSSVLISGLFDAIAVAIIFLLLVREKSPPALTESAAITRFQDDD